MGDWESLRNGVWNFLLYISLFPLFSIFSSFIIDNSYFEMFWIKFVIHHSELNTYRYHIAGAAGSNNPLLFLPPSKHPTTSHHIPPSTLLSSPHCKRINNGNLRRFHKTRPNPPAATNPVLRPLSPQHCQRRRQEPVQTDHPPGHQEMA